jgi:hypothetical protein
MMVFGQLLGFYLRDQTCLHLHCVVFWLVWLVSVQSPHRTGDAVGYINESFRRLSIAPSPQVAIDGISFHKYVS